MRGDVLYRLQTSLWENTALKEPNCNLNPSPNPYPAAAEPTSGKVPGPEPLWRQELDLSHNGLGPDDACILAETICGDQPRNQGIDLR